MAAVSTKRKEPGLKELTNCGFVSTIRFQIGIIKIWRSNGSGFQTKVLLSMTAFILIVSQQLLQLQWACNCNESVWCVADGRKMSADANNTDEELPQPTMGTMSV